MSTLLRVWPFILLAYFVGAIPFAFVLGKLLGFDIRRHGSGNIGATNLTRVAGRKYGMWCFALDFLKGSIPVLVASLSGPGRDLPWLTGVVAAAAVAGHVWPVYLGFKGGKGVATTLGVLIVLAPAAMLVGVVAWLLVFSLSRYVSLASMAAAVCLPLGEVGKAWLGGQELSWARLSLLILLAAFIICRHQQNIKRLWAGQEHRFNRKQGAS